MKKSTFVKHFKKSNIGKVFPIALLFFSIFYSITFAQMNSGSYKIPIDSINIGGQGSGSASYNLLDTAGEAGSGDSGSASYKINAGFINAQQTYLAISSPSDVTMSPSINGLTGGAGDGSSAWVVTTDNGAGYTLTIKSNTNPALASAGDSFDNYGPAGGNPDYTWSILTTAGEFGYTVEGVDTAQRFLDNGSGCNASTGNVVDKCWDGFNTTGTEVSRRVSSNHPSGTATTIKYRADSGTSNIQESGNYQATIEVTLLAL